ncbi:putative COP9 signalosome subunit 2 [Xylogone sp. PMI_703]|nr:putative COP9 signalosome subunit 2 [Xylogone sp. PMI_703]
MSDDDDFMQDSDDGEAYDFEYEEDSQEEGGDIDIENKYYNAKQIKATNPEEAIEEFLGVPAMEKEKGDWGFKGIKQAIKLEYKLGWYDKAAQHYGELLTYVKSAVTRNYSEKSINNMLDYIEKGSDDDQARKCMEEFYSQTLETFQATNNERLWLKTNVKLAKLFLDRKNYVEVAKKLRELHKACQKEDGTDDPNKGTFSLEIYAMEIQMCVETKNNKQLKRLYQRALKVRSAVPHPKIQGIIRECGGKMHMSEENWTEAQSDFFESFRNYDEAGSLQRIQVLKYLVLTTMLMKSEINPFESQETKPYRDDPRIKAMTDLVEAYQKDDIHKYEAVLENNKDLLEDPFIAENIDEVTRNMRTKAVLNIIAPYSRFNIEFVSKQLKIPRSEVIDILGYLIIDKRVNGKINMHDGTVEITDISDAQRLNALQEWNAAINSLYQAVFADGDGFKMPDLPSGMGEDKLGLLAGVKPLKGSGKRGLKSPPGAGGKSNVSSKGFAKGKGNKGKKKAGGIFH